LLAEIIEIFIQLRLLMFITFRKTFLFNQFTLLLHNKKGLVPSAVCKGVSQYNAGEFGLVSYSI